MTKLGRIMTVVCLLAGFSGFAQAGGIERMQGEWVNLQNNQHPSVKISGGSFGSDVWISNWGRARISYSTCGGGNIRINDNQLNCCFYATFINHSQGVVWQVDAGNGPQCPYLSGTYSRAD